MNMDKTESFLIEQITVEAFISSDSIDITQHLNKTTTSIIIQRHPIIFL